MVIRDRASMVNLSLSDAYLRYKATVTAINAYKELWGNGSWKKQGFSKLNEVDIIEYFVGKTLWYNQWVKIFPDVSSFPTMVDWLENTKDKESDFDVWGVIKNTGYTKEDLKSWIANGGSLIKKKGKGKEKEKKTAESQGSTSTKDKHRKASSSKR